MDKLTYDKDLHIFLDAEGNPATQEDILLWGAENPIVTLPDGKQEVVSLDQQAKQMAEYINKYNIDSSLVPNIANQIGQSQSPQEIIANLFEPKIPVQMPEQNVQQPLQTLQSLQPTDLTTEDQNYGY